MKNFKSAIWFPTVRTNTGTDKFTEQLVAGLKKQGFQAEISWLPHHAEYLPWVVKKISPPDWANIVHVNSWLHPKFYSSQLPIVSTVHLCVQDPMYLPYKTLAQKYYHQLWVTSIEKKSFALANCITAVSQYTAACVENIFDIQAVKAIYNGIDTDIFCDHPRLSKEKNKPFRLLFVGTNSVRKGFDLLPRIMEELGDGFELQYTKSETSAAIVSKNMKPIPYQSPSDLAHLYRSVDALIFPSRLEGFGLVIAEAMACGLPVVVARSSALTELVEHHVTGFLCEQDNIDEFVQTIQYLEQNSEVCVEVGKRARDAAIKKFNLDDMVNKYTDLYNQILQSQ